MPVVRLAVGAANGTAHFGAMLDGVQPVTACSTHSPDLAPIAAITAHQMCQSCTRALLILTTPPHRDEPDGRPAVGAGLRALAHLPIPGHLLGYCGRPLDARRATATRVCGNCTRLAHALETFQRCAGKLLLPAGEPCHGDDTLLWAAKGRGGLVTGHYRNSVTGDAYCAAQLVGLTPGAQECASCRQHRQEVQAVRQIYILPSLRDDAARWPQHTTEVFTDTASALRVGDAYTVPGCTDRHHVVAVSDRLHDTHTDLLVYLSGEDRLVDARVRRGRLVRIERPANPPHTRTPLS